MWARKSLGIPTEAARRDGYPRPVAAVFSERALASCMAETLQHGGDETGGLLLGHRAGPLWYVVESVDPGPNSRHRAANFEYDHDYVNHLINKLRWYYAKPLDLMGLWHRHPGSFDSFSATDHVTHRRFLNQQPEGILSALINIDPRPRMTVYSLAQGGERHLPAVGGDGWIPPALLSYRAGPPAPPSAYFLLHALGYGKDSAPPGMPSDLERLLAMTEEDLDFLARLCGKLTMRAGADGALEVLEEGNVILRFSGGDGGAAMRVGARRLCQDTRKRRRHEVIAFAFCGWIRGSDRSGQLGDRGLAVGGVVGVDDALAHSLVQGPAGDARGLTGLLGVSGGDSLTHAANLRAQVRLHSLVTLAGDFVRLDPLDLRLDVCHGLPFSFDRC